MEAEDGVGAAVGAGAEAGSGEGEKVGVGAQSVVVRGVRCEGGEGGLEVAASGLLEEVYVEAEAISSRPASRLHLGEICCWSDQPASECARDGWSAVEAIGAHTSRVQNSLSL